MASLQPVQGTPEEILALLREWEGANDPDPLVIETSGSTGRPKRVLLSRDAMRASANATHERLGGPGRWVLNLPPTYVAGVQVLYRSVLAGTDPIFWPGSFAQLALSSRSYVSLVSTQLVRLLADRRESAALAGFAAVLIGGGPLDPGVRANAESLGVPIVATYGMSETCGGCVYDGYPLADVEVRIDAGEVLLRGPLLFDGYQDEPDRTASALREGWFATDDLGHLDDDGRLWIDGRADDVIISGGVKVSAGVVASMVAVHPRVKDVQVVGVADPEWGQRVVAVVVGDVTLAELRALVTPREWAPRQVVVVDEIPQLAHGKTDRLALERLASDA